MTEEKLKSDPDDGKIDFTPVVVVADDVDDVRALIKRMLDNLKVKTVLCSNGKGLMEYVTQENAKFDLILLDLSMPEMNGLEVLQALQDIKKRKAFKICVLSGHNDPKIIARASELKADDFLNKPFDKDIFQNRVTNLLGLERTKLAEFAFVKAKFPAQILKLPILATFNIVGITEEGITMESPVNYREDSILTFTSKAFCEAINSEQEFTIRVIKSQSPEKDKYLISAAYYSMSETLANKIRAFTVRNAKSSSSVFA